MNTRRALSARARRPLVLARRHARAARGRLLTRPTTDRTGAGLRALGLAVATACALALGSCNGDTTGVDLISTVVVSPASPVTEVGLGVQLTATALDAGGATLSGIEAAWESENPSVATVSEDGLASGQSVGTTTITATMGGISNSVVLTVEPNRCEQPAEVQLAPGEHASFGADECLRLPAGAAQDLYRIAVIRPTQVGNASDTTTITLRINPVAVAVAAEAAEGTAPPPASTAAGSTSAPAGAGASVGPAAQVQDGSALRGIDGTRALEAVALRRSTMRFHTELRTRERALGLDRMTPLPTVPRGAAPLRVDPPSSRSFRLAFGCDAGDGTATPATLVAFNDDMAIYQDTEERESKEIGTAAANMMLDYYSDYVRDMSNAYWGETPDIDGNQRVLVTTSPELADTVAAAVFSGDFASTADCPSSDEGEVIYFSADVILRLSDPDPGWSALGTLAHEAKHVTSLFHGVARGPSPTFHPLWIEEGTAEIATEMSSRIAWDAIGGPPVGSVVTGEDITQTASAYTGPGNWPPEIDGIIGNLAALIAQLSTHPNSLLLNPPGADSLHTFYAAGWHINRFIGDAWGDASVPLADSALFRALTDSTGPAAGAAGLEELTARSFTDLFADFAVAASLHAVPGAVQPTRAFTTYDLVSATNIFSGPEELTPPGVYPWPITTRTTAADTTLAAGFTSASFTQLEGPSGMQFYDFLSDTGLDVLVRVTNAPGTTLVVIRLR